MYEAFRNEFMLEIMSLPQETAQTAIQALDRVAAKYDFSKKELSLTPYGQELPDVAKMYLVVKKMAGLSDGTLSNYKLMLELFFRRVRLPPERVGPNDIRMFLYDYQIERGVSARTWTNIGSILQGSSPGQIQRATYPKIPQRAFRPLSMR